MDKNKLLGLALIAQIGLEKRLKEEKADCPHETGHRTQEYDSDGCGYYVWVCDNCGATELDDTP